MFAQMSAPSGGETIQESLLLLAYERFQQSQQRQPLASLPMGVLAICENVCFLFLAAHFR